MSMQFCDSFSHYATADITKKYLQNSGGSISATGGRRGQGCLRHGFQGTTTAPVMSGDDEVYVGFAMKTTGVGQRGPFCGFGDENYGTIIMVCNEDGSVTPYQNWAAMLSVNNNVSRSPIGTPTAPWTLNWDNWYYIEVYLKAHASAGVITLRVNGITIKTWTNLDTRNGMGTASTRITQFAFFAGHMNMDAYFCDLYINDANGSVNNGFLGDVRVDPHFPIEDGTTLEWTPSTGSDHFEMVNEVNPDLGVTYNTTNTLNAIDTLVLEDLKNNGGTIKGVQMVVLDDKTDAGPCTVAPVVRIDGVNYASVDSHAPSETSYVYARKVYDVQPDTTAWNETDFNASEWGYKKTV